jgi:hypothetical protein
MDSAFPPGLTQAFHQGFICCSPGFSQLAQKLPVVVRDVWGREWVFRHANELLKFADSGLRGTPQ